MGAVSGEGVEAAVTFHYKIKGSSCTVRDYWFKLKTPKDVVVFTRLLLFGNIISTLHLPVSPKNGNSAVEGLENNLFYYYAHAEVPCSVGGWDTSLSL